MTTPMGYEMQTTFVEDFMIAEHFGKAAIQDTFDRAFNEWRDNYVYMTELVIALNWGLWRTYESGQEDLAQLYNDLWETADSYCLENFNEDELAFFFRVTD